MSYENVPLNDRVAAHSFSLATRGLKIIPPLDRRMIGPNTIPGGWRVSYVDGRIFDGRWQSFPGVSDEELSPLDRKFGNLAMMSVLATEVRPGKPGYEDALVMEIGERAVVVGVLAKKYQFASITSDRVSYDSERLYTGAGLGPEPVKFMAAQYNPREDIIFVPPSLQWEGVVPMTDLPQELRVRPS